MEYWLQKKSLSGWSVVTWYSDLAQARTNYLKCIGNGMSGYSWRLVAVEVVEQAMLDEVTEVEAPEVITKTYVDSKLIDTDKPVVVNGWISSKLAPDQQADVNNAWANFKTCNTVSASHGLVGSVWLINHKTLVKIRVPANQVDRYLSQGYERGGPKTKFRT